MFKRYAIYFTPPQGALAEFGARWLGWDCLTGQLLDHPVIDGVDVKTLTRRAQKYGFHGTLKAPFRLADPHTETDLCDAARDLATHLSPVRLDGLHVVHENGFIALRPTQASSELTAFATRIVKELDAFRAPLTQDDLVRRRKARLSLRQDQQLVDWGYPFIFDDFNFHITLSGHVDPDAATTAINALVPLITPHLTSPFMIDAITVAGEDTNGMFHAVQRYPVGG